MNGGIVIQERPCQRCSIRRTVLMGTGRLAFCFNCRSECASNESTVGAGSARLRRYRAAVRTGLYSDWTDYEIAPATEHADIQPRVARGNEPDPRQPMFGR